MERRWQIRDTIIVSVYNRPEMVLLNTLISVQRQDLTDTEVLIVDDGSDMDYSDLREILDDWKMPHRWHVTSTLENRPDTYCVDGYNSPAYVNNLAATMAEGENLYFLASDTILPPNTMGSARVWDLDKTVYTIKVVDMDSGVVWNDEARPYPLAWFLGVSKSLFNRVGGFDEEYLKGLSFDALDFSARAVLDTKKLVLDCGTTAFHQTHAASSTLDDGLGARASYAYTKRKWGGVVPWNGLGAPLHYTTSRAGDKVIVTPHPKDDLLEKLRSA